MINLPSVFARKDTFDDLNGLISRVLSTYTSFVFSGGQPPSKYPRVYLMDKLHREASSLHFVAVVTNR